MALTLTIVSPDTEGVQTRRHLQDGPLTIGRDPGVDWPLPDPGRLLSRHHCTIELDHGTWYLVDHSTNGVYLGPDRHRVDRGLRVALEDGVVLSLGDYRIQASLQHEPEPSAPPATTTEPEPGPWRTTGAEPPAGPAGARFTGIDPWPDEDPGPAAEPGPGAALIPDALSLLDRPGDALLPKDFDPGAAVDDLVLAEYASFREPEPLSAVEPAPEPATAPVPAPSPRPAPAPDPGAGSDRATADALVDAFLQGAGLQRSRIAPADADSRALFRAIGTSYRQLVEGLVDVLRARSQTKSELRADQTLLGRERNNPIKFAVGVEDAMEHLLQPRGGAFLGPEEAVREAFQDLQTHQLALMAAVQVTLRDLLRRLDPQALEMRFGARPGLLGRMVASAEAQKWHAFTTLYGDITRELDEDFREFFRREVRQAYEAQIGRLRSP